MRAQRGCGGLPSGAYQGRGRTGPVQALRPLKHGCPADTPGDGAVQDSPMTDQNSRFSSAHSSRARRKYLEISLSPHSASGPERYWSSLPHFQTPCHFFLLPQFPSCHMLMLEWARFKASCGLSPHMSFFSTKAAFPGLTQPGTPQDLTWKAYWEDQQALGPLGTLGPQIFS